jgi:tetratricopeptide (TPR) repeat protein
MLMLFFNSDKFNKISAEQHQKRSSIFDDNLKTLKTPFITVKFFSVLLIFLAISVSLKSQVNYDHFIRLGQMEMQKSRYLEAINNFNTAIYSKKEGFEAYFLRGIAKFSLGDFQGAINDFSKTIALHPLYVRAYHYRGISRDRMYDYALAISDFDKALKIDPFNAELFLARGDTKLHLNDYQGAVEDYTSAIDLDHELAAAWLNRGVSYHLLNEHEKALSDLNQAIQLDYFNVQAWAKRGIVRYEIDSLDQAIADFNHAISLDDENPLVYFQRGLTYLKLNDTVAALKDYDKVIDLEPDNALTFYNRALIKSMQENYEEALEDYTAAAQINPLNVYAYFNRGIVNAELEHLDNAEADFTRCIEIFPDFVGAYVNRSVVRQQKGDRFGSVQDHDIAMNIIEELNSDKKDYETIYRRYQDSIYFNKIIEFEADFVSGNVKKGRIQFQRITIEPKPNFFLVYAIKSSSPVDKENAKNEYYDENIAKFNANNRFGIKLVFTTREGPVSNETTISELQRIDSAILIAGDTAGAYFMKGVVNSMLQNYSIAINAYNKALKHDPYISYAYLNRGTTQYELDEFIFNEQEYTSAITISRSGYNEPRKEIEEPDYHSTMDDYSKVIRQNPDLPFVYYNRANVQLRLKEYHRAIDNYSRAIELEPDMAEAYYNRALTLLFLEENELACKDLSIAGELGITDAYNVIKRYCHK